MMRKINFILCILIALIFIGQTAIMTQPYLQYEDKPTLFEQSQGIESQIINYSLMEFVWTGWTAQSEMDDFLIEHLEKAGKIDAGTANDKMDQLGEQSNTYVLGLVGITVLGAVFAIMCIFTRKSAVHFCFNLAWALCGLYACFGDNYVFQSMNNAPGADTIKLLMQIFAIAGMVLTLARAYPWFYSRFIYKDPIDLEALNA